MRVADGAIVALSPLLAVSVTTIREDASFAGESSASTLKFCYYLLRCHQDYVILTRQLQVIYRLYRDFSREGSIRSLGSGTSNNFIKSRKRATADLLSAGG